MPLFACNFLSCLEPQEIISLIKNENITLLRMIVETLDKNWDEFKYLNDVIEQYRNVHYENEVEEQNWERENRRFFKILKEIPFREIKEQVLDIIKSSKINYWPLILHGIIEKFSYDELLDVLRDSGCLEIFLNSISKLTSSEARLIRRVYWFGDIDLNYYKNLEPYLSKPYIEPIDTFLNYFRIDNRPFSIEIKDFQVNEYITLKLEKDKTVIYVKGEEFMICKFLSANIPIDNIYSFGDTISIDEAVEKQDSREMRKLKNSISPDIEFWAHCSNLQVWFENNYNTDLLHSSLAFPLLKKLSEFGDPVAKSQFKSEIIKRFETGYQPTAKYLIKNNYLEVFTSDELINLLFNSDCLFCNIFKKILRDKGLSLDYLFQWFLYLEIIDKLATKEMLIDNIRKLVDLSLDSSSHLQKNFIQSIVNLELYFIYYYISAYQRFFLYKLSPNDSSEFRQWLNNEEPKAIAKYYEQGEELIDVINYLKEGIKRELRYFLKYGKYDESIIPENFK